MAKKTYSIVDSKTRRAIMTVKIRRNVRAILKTLNKKNPNKYVLVITEESEDHGVIVRK